MSEARSEQKNQLRFKKYIPEAKNLTEIEKCNAAVKSFPRQSSLDLISKKESSVPPPKDKLGFASRIANQTVETANKKDWETKAYHRLSLQCINQPCQKDDVISVLSFGEYNGKSKSSKYNIIVHNHRKIPTETIYDFQEDQIPQLKEQIHRNFEQIIEIQAKMNLNQTKNQNQKSRSRYCSPFTYLFANKKDNKNQQQRQIIHDQKRQKEEIEKYDKELEKIKQIQKDIKLQKMSTYVTKHPLKHINKLQEQRIQKNAIFLKSGNKKQEKNNELNEKVRTRQQQKNNQLSDFQVSRQPQPFHSCKYCYPCRIKFEDYKSHIQSIDHKWNIQRALGNSYIIDQIDYFHKCKKQEINSFQYRYLKQLVEYLQALTEETECFFLNKNKQLKVSLKQIYEEIQNQFKIRS